MKISLLLFLLAAFALLVGCSPSAFAQHYQANTVLTGTRGVAYAAVMGARSAALDAVEEANPPPPSVGDEATDEDRLAYERAVAARDALLDTASAAWDPATSSLDGILSTLETWAASVTVARAADEDEDLLPPLVDVAGRVVQLYSDLVRLAASLGLVLPAVPVWISGLVGGV